MKSISLFVLFWASINIHAVDNLRISDIRSLGMGGNGVTQSVLLIRHWWLCIRIKFFI